MTLKPKSSGLVRPICVYHVKGAVITGCCRQLGLEYRVDGGRASRHPEPRHSLMSPVTAACAGTMRARSHICLHAQPWSFALLAVTHQDVPEGSHSKQGTEGGHHPGKGSPRGELEHILTKRSGMRIFLALQHNTCVPGLSKHTPRVCFQPLHLADVALKDMV